MCPRVSKAPSSLHSSLSLSCRCADARLLVINAADMSAAVTFQLGGNHGMQRTG